MDWITGIQNAIDYIEEHLTEEMDYDIVAKQSFSSTYHFQRLFLLCYFIKLFLLQNLPLAASTKCYRFKRNSRTASPYMAL